VALPAAAVDELFERCAEPPGLELTIDLEAQSVRDGKGFDVAFEIDPYRREMLMRGLDEIGRTLLDESSIAVFESRRTLLAGTP
jgi:3-isopropylmalate/(R)-2-methylmalate dehydratase small subunit